MRPCVPGAQKIHFQSLIHPQFESMIVGLEPMSIKNVRPLSPSTIHGMSEKGLDAQ